MEKENVSIRGRIARNSLRFLMHLPLKGDIGLKFGSKAAKEVAIWRTPKGHTLEKYNIDGIPIEKLICDGQKTDKVILQFHGGAYFIKLNDLYRQVARKYCSISNGASVVSVDYKTAPDYKFPAALEDALISWNWLIESGYSEENIIVVGDSAGGNLALALTLRLRDENRKLPKALILMSPWTDMARSGKSYRYNLHNDPMFGLKKGDNDISFIDKSLLWTYAGDTKLDDKYLSPAYGEYDNFPPMLIQVGSYEVLESDSMTVYEKAKAASVDVTLTDYKGMFHVFQLLGNLIPEAKQAWLEVENFLSKHLNNDSLPADNK